MSMHRERLERCFETCARPAWRVAVAMLGNVDDAHDVVQQAFLVAAKKPANIPDPAWGWFRKVVIHEARNHRRKRKPVGMDGSEMQVPGKQIDPQTESMRREQSRELHAALDGLRDEEREALTLTTLGGLTHREAAESLGVPVKTISTRVLRGRENLKHKLGDKGEAMLSSVAAMPVVAPPQGWDLALAGWKANALAILPGVSTTAGATAGGIIMAKKAILVAGAAIAIGVGFAGGMASGYVMGSEESQGAVASQNAPQSDRSSSGDSSVSPSNGSVHDTPPDGETTGGSATASNDTSDGVLSALRDELKQAQTDRDTFKAKVEELNQQLAPLLKDKAERGPTFTFGRHGKIEGVTNANWREMAGASHAVSTALQTMLEHQRKGEPVPREVRLTLQKNTEIMRKYEYDTIQVLPTWAKHNGELTHPISLTNLIAAELKLANDPLTDDQISRIEALGLQWEKDFESASAAYNDATPRVTKMRDEFKLKGEFADAMWDVMTTTQREHIIPSEWRHVAFVDLYCPTLMVIHTSPILTGADIDEIVTKLRAMLVKKFAVPEDSLVQLDGFIETWRTDVASTLTPVAKGSARQYTFDIALTCATATSKLVTSIRDLGGIPSEAMTALLNDYAIYIPRVIAG